MSRTGTLVVLAFASGLVPSLAKADLPLSVEDLITDRGRVKLDLSLTYANVDNADLSVGDLALVQVGPTSFVVVPTQFGTGRTNSDTLVGTLGLRYGVTKKTEIFLRSSLLYSAVRSSGVGGTISSDEARWADAWIGLNHQFKADTTTPALLGFVETAVYDRQRSDSSPFRSYTVGLTTYRAIDPVVFSLTAAYRFGVSRRDGAEDLKPGRVITLNPEVGFAVNDRVSLSTGFQWISRDADERNGIDQGAMRTSTALVLGVAYGFAKGSLIDTTVTANVSGQDGAELRFSWLQTF